MPSLSVEIKGVPELMRKLAPEWLYWPLAKRALEQMGQAAARQASNEAGSFKKTGALSAGITHKMAASPKPVWVAVTTRKLPRRYAWILEFESRFGHKNWFLNAVKRGQRTGNPLAGLVSAIEAKWRS